MTTIKVSNNSIQSSARKVRVVCDLIRKKPVKDALSILRFCEKKHLSIILTKLINSGLAQAEQKATVDLSALEISEIFVNEGPTMKRIQPRAQGRAYRIRCRTSYVTVVLGEK